MVEKYKHEYTYDKIDHDYKELHIPAGPSGEFLLEKTPYTFGQEATLC